MPAGLGVGGCPVPRGAAGRQGVGEVVKLLNPAGWPGHGGIRRMNFGLMPPRHHGTAAHSEASRVRREIGPGGLHWETAPGRQVI